MKLVYVTDKAWLPESSGGAQYSTLFLLRELQKLGWDVEVFCNTSSSNLKKALARKGSLGFHKGHPMVEEHSLGFKATRRWQMRPILAFLDRRRRNRWIDWADAMISQSGADVVMGDMAASHSVYSRSIKKGLLAVKFIRSMPLIGNPSVVHPELLLIANSTYSAAAAEVLLKKSIPIVRPCINPADYISDVPDPEYITFINPNFQKGIDVAVRIVERMPHRRFLVVKGKWSGFSTKYIDRMTERFTKYDNVDIWDHQTDMKSVYAKTKVLMVPSQFIETFGRVIIEAQCNGVPVVGSAIGGIPDTVGNGGIVVSPHHKPGPFVDAIERILENEETYKDFSQQAKLNAARPDFDAATQVDNFMGALNTALEEMRTRKEIVRENELM